MVGVFQLFGISFVFWTCVSVLRFVFETLRKLRDAPRTDSLDNRTLAISGGVGIGVSIFWLIFFGFGLADTFRAGPDVPAVTLAMLIIWLTCTGIGAYLASRIYIHEPYFISVMVAGGTILTVFLLFIVSHAPVISALGSLWYATLWVVSTFAAALLGGRMAAALNLLEREDAAQRAKDAAQARILPREVAIVIAAHNEELTIGTTIQSVLRFTPASNVYVGSDGSSDRTVEITRALGAHADDIQPNRGKAGAIVFTLKKNHLLDRYKAIFLMDADLEVDKDFLTYALPAFDDPKVAAVAGHLVSYWPEHYVPQWHLFFSAYRIRLWRVLQFCVRYGQTWRYVNISPIIPGGGSLYRSSALRQINIIVPGLVIEDFNMTFDVHHKKLGTIAFDHRAYSVTQEPFSFRDYKKQTYRWSLGFFQTIRHHGVWPSWFFFATALFTLELVLSSALFIVTPFVALALALGFYDTIQIPIPFFHMTITLFGLVVAVFILDYLITVIVALIERKPVLLLYGPGFFFLRYVEALLFFKAMAVGMFTKPNAEGKWKSPQRVAYHSGQG